MNAMTQGQCPAVATDPQRDDAWLRGARPFCLDARQADTLFRTVETEIIPRLMLLHGGSGATPPAADVDSRVLVDTHEVERFTELLLRGLEPAAAHLLQRIESGAALDALCLGLLAPAARRLGELWNADLCDFTAVTIGLGRLHALLRGLSSNLRLPAATQADGRSALFAPVTGEQHTFGLTMVCDFFRSAGWDVWGNSPADPESVLVLVRDHRFDVIGLAIGNDRSTQALAELIRAVRKSSRNRAVLVLVGGPLLVVRPEVCAQVGADATAPDASQAMLAAERLVAMRDRGR